MRIVVGMDPDGPIYPNGFYNPSVRLPQWLFVVLVPIIEWRKPKKQVVEKMQALTAQGYIFLIFSGRPKWFFRRTERLLKRHSVPFESLYCVGFGKGTNDRKLKVIREEKIEIFIDDNERVLKFLQSNSVKAVSSLDYLN